MTIKSTKSNRLASETSPYLLQHADNPVDWYPWGTEAFDAAKRKQQTHPAFCWICCLPLVSRHGPRKFRRRIDRSADEPAFHQRQGRPRGAAGRRPHLYGCPASDGGTRRLAIDHVSGYRLQPFWGGTYFPPTASMAVQASTGAHTDRNIWHDQQDKIGNNTKAILAQLQAKPPASTGHTITPDLLQTVARQLLQVYDDENGGIGSAPKFPQSPIFQLLWTLNNTLDLPQQEAVRHTMTMISQGGIYDHLAGGMARYTVDARWLVPHFEKMLYDNAQYVSLLSQLVTLSHANCSGFESRRRATGYSTT
jgi:uncharacterized protein YyaL (SSP411 family)